MSLNGFTPRTETVEFPGGEFAVRGLSLEDLTVLTRSYFDPLNSLFDKYVAEAAAAAIDQKVADGKMGLGDIKSVALEALEVAPGMLGDAIARAAGEPENAALARLLPIGVQLDAVEKIVRLTLEAEGGLGKLMERIQTLWTALTGAAANPSP